MIPPDHRFFHQSSCPDQEEINLNEQKSVAASAVLDWIVSDPVGAHHSYRC